MNKIYITTAIPYVNGAPHVGHALDYCLADTYARYRRLNGDEARLQAGVDEHGNKIYQKAVGLGLPVEQYVGENAKKFRDFVLVQVWRFIAVFVIGACGGYLTYRQSVKSGTPNIAYLLSFPKILD